MYYAHYVDNLHTLNSLFLNYFNAEWL